MRWSRYGSKIEEKGGSFARKIWAIAVSKLYDRVSSRYDEHSYNEYDDLFLNDCET